MTQYTLADLTRFCGAKRRSVQLWAESGALRPNPETDRAGTGTHRTFGAVEAVVACVLAAAAIRQIAIGELARIGSMVRQQLYQHDRAEVFNAAIRGEGRAWLVVFLPEGRGQIEKVTTDRNNLIHFEPQDTELLNFAEVFAATGPDRRLAYVIDLNASLIGLREEFPDGLP